MIDKNKVDPELGLKVEAHLKDKGINTPMIEADFRGRQEKIQKAFVDIMKALSLDLNDDSLSETPIRMSKMYNNEIFAGLYPGHFPKVTTVENKFQYNQMLIEGGISVKSVCEHHFVPFFGKAVVAYIPEKKVVGLSKLNRIVEYFSRRPQVQERLTEQIFHTLALILETEHIAVLIKAQHLCVKLRGVEDDNSETVTSKMGGAFIDKENLARMEFMNLAKDLI